MPYQRGLLDLFAEEDNLAQRYAEEYPTMPGFPIAPLPEEGHQGRELLDYILGGFPFSNKRNREWVNPENLSDEELAYRMLNPSLMYDELEPVRGEIPDLWHGSPHKFDKFKWEALGSGEGGAAFGAGGGGYHTMKKGIAEAYSDAGTLGTKSVKIGDKIISTRGTTRLDATVEDYAVDALTRFGGDKKKAIDWLDDFGSDLEARTWINKNIKGKKAEIVDTPKHLYRTTAFKGKDPSEYTLLDWYEPVDDKIKDKIARELTEYKIKKHNIDTGKPGFKKAAEKDTRLNRQELDASNTGQYFYQTLDRMVGNKVEASKFLKRAGIDGIRYPTETLSGKAKTGRDSFNYVIFDPKDVHIEDVISY